MDPQQLSPPPKYNKALIVVIAVLILVILVLLLKSPLPAPPPRPTAGHPERDRPPGPENQKIKQGIVSGYKYNAHLDVNALELKTKTEGTITVEFPPHTAKMVMATGTIGQQVELAITSRPNDEQVGYRLMSIKNITSGKKFNTRDLPPPPDVPGQLIESFKLVSPIVITDSYGGIVALRKNDLFFHFKPGLVDDIAGLIKSTRQFGLQAVRRNDDLGFINVRHDKVYIVLSLNIDNKTFLVR